MKTDLTSIPQILDDFVLQYNLKDEAVRRCMVAMTNCLEDDPAGLSGFGLNEIKFDFKSHTFIFEHHFYPTPFIKTEIGIYKTVVDEIYVGNHEPIGYYQLDTDLEGNHFDDWLIINEEKNNQLNSISAVQSASEKLPEKYLRRNSIYYEYISFIAHITMLYQTRHLKACQYSMVRAFKFLAATEIADDFKAYARDTKRYIKALASYMQECDLIDDAMAKKLREISILPGK